MRPLLLCDFPHIQLPWWKFPLDNPLQIHEILKHPFSGISSIFHPDPSFSRVPDGCFLAHCSWSLTSWETFHGEYCVCGIMRTNTTDDSYPRVCRFQTLLPPFLVLPRTIPEGAWGKRWMGRRPGEMGWTPEIQVSTGMVVNYYTEPVLEAGKRLSSCWEVVL